MELNNYLLIEIYESIIKWKIKIKFSLISFRKQEIPKIEKKITKWKNKNKNKCKKPYNDDDDDDDDDNNNNNKTIKMYIPSPPIYPPPPLHRLNNVLNVRMPFLKMLGSFLGSCLLISSSMLLIISVAASKCSMLR